MGSRRTAAVTAAALLLGCGSSGTAPLMEDRPEERWESFSVAELRAGMPDLGVRFATGVQSSSFRVGLLRAPTGEEVGPAVHRVNAVYLVESGVGTLTTQEESWPLVEGTVVFVRGDVEHRLREITSTLELVVAFREETLATNVDPAVVVLDPEEMTPARDPERSTWNPLLSTSNIDLGVYSVPKGMDPDVLMAHAVDELKIIVDGEARFDIGSGGVQVSPGSVAFIENRVPHRFRRVAEALDVLVLFER